MNELNELTYRIRGAAFRVHSALGPGLLESIYELCLAHELRKEGLKVERQKALSVCYDGLELGTGYRMDILVEDRIVLELKAVKETTPVDMAQLLTYMRLSEVKVGLLMNFHVARMKDGIQRFVL